VGGAARVGGTEVWSEESGLQRRETSIGKEPQDEKTVNESVKDRLKFSAE